MVSAVALTELERGTGRDIRWQRGLRWV